MQYRQRQLWGRGSVSAEMKNRERGAQQNCNPEDDEGCDRHVAKLSTQPKHLPMARWAQGA